VLTIATVYYAPHGRVPDFARGYTPEWVDRLYRGVARHLSAPFRFVCLTERPCAFTEPIEQQTLMTTRWDQACKQLYGIAADRLLLLGLDTVIVGDLDDLVAYDGPLAVPRDPYHPDRPCNAVVLCPSRPDLTEKHGSDMRVLDGEPVDWLDDLFPKQIRSYKVHVLSDGLGDARIVYLHGSPKQPDIPEPWMAEAWR